MAAVWTNPDVEMKTRFRASSCEDDVTNAVVGTQCMTDHGDTDMWNDEAVMKAIIEEEKRGWKKEARADEPAKKSTKG